MTTERRRGTVSPRQVSGSARVQKVYVSLQGRVGGIGVHRMSELLGYLKVSLSVLPVEVQRIASLVVTFAEDGFSGYAPMLESPIN